MAAILGGTVSELTGGKFANGAATAALSAAVSEGLRSGTKNDIHSEDTNTDGPRGPDRFTPEERDAIKQQLKDALSTQPKGGFKNDVEAMKWFKENIHPIANQGNRPLADFEVSAILTELLSTGNVKFFDIDTFFRNNLAPGNQNVHTHQTTNWWSEGDQAINDGRSIPKAKVYPNRYLVNDSSVFRFRQQDFFNTEGAKARDFYQVLDYEKNDWVNQ